MNRPYFTATFWLDTLERAIKTLAQAVLGVLVGHQVDSAIDFRVSAWIVGSAVLTSICTSMISTSFGEPGSASLLNPAPPDTLEGDRGQASVGTIVLIAVLAVLAVLYVLSRV